MCTRIMVVSGDPDVLRAVTWPLRARGDEVVTAQTGTDALVQIADEPPQLLVVDISLADMTGLQVCLQLRKSQDTVDIPVVMLAGRNQIYPNPDAYIVKPIDVPSLLSCVAEVMHGSYLFTPGAFSRDCWVSP